MTAWTNDNPPFDLNEKVVKVYIGWKPSYRKNGKMVPVEHCEIVTENGNKYCVLPKDAKKLTGRTKPTSVRPAELGWVASPKFNKTWDLLPTRPNT